MKLSTTLLTISAVSLCQHVEAFQTHVRGSNHEHGQARKTKSGGGKKGKDSASDSKQGKKKNNANKNELDNPGPHPPTYRATKLLTDTELFQENVYSQPVVSSEDSGSHCLLEGMRSYPRIQVDFNATEQAEAKWLDQGYHQGPAELVQLELVKHDNGNESWQLVHYRHPWTARTDGGRADGLVRDVLMSGLKDPKSVHCITGSYTNRVQTHNGQQWNTAAYAIYVEQGSTPDDFVLIGKGHAVWDVNSAPEYPVVWSHRILDDFHDLDNVGSLRFASKYVQTPWYSNMEKSNYANYDAERGVEHIILYYKDQLVVMTLLDYGQTDNMEIAFNKIHYQDGDNSARVAHLTWTPDPTQDHWKRLHNIVTVRSEFENNGAIKYHTFQMHESDSDEQHRYTFDDLQNFYTVVKWESDHEWHKESFEPVQHKKDSNYHVDLEQIRDVHEMYFIDGIDSDDVNANVKICNVLGHGVFILTIKKNGNGNYELQGMFPLLFPDSNGVGQIQNFGGGTSKFGGLRFIANDQNSNLFMMRQRGTPSSASFYDLPIYGLYDEEGSPLTHISKNNHDSIPKDTSSVSNLHELYDWYLASAGGDSALFYNILLNAALAFGTDESNVAQGIYFGSGYKAAYAMKRFGMDSEHVVIRSVESSDTSYVAISTFKNPVTKAWHRRPIAMQALPETMKNETGDHYHASLTFANYAGQTVSPLNGANSGLKIEVRCDSPCTITDDTNGFYHNIDRYTSFMAQPDPVSGMLSLTVPADTFSQVIYARIVNATALQVSSDKAILNSIDADIYPWVAVNMAEKAQQRMSNGDSSSGSTLTDKRLYMSQQNLTDSNKNNTWQTKGGYKTTSGNMKDLSTYCTTSGANLLVATDELGMGGGADSINPLFSFSEIPEDSSRPEFTTTFSYGEGSIKSDYSSSRRLRGQEHRQLNVFSSLSHDLHDALHYLQHVEGKVYKELGNDGVAIASAENGLSVTVSKAIMKEMKGVDKALTQVVSSVEEYGSIVLNVIVTIVEAQFMFTFIELLIALISMFIYFDDILELSNSFSKAFERLQLPINQDISELEDLISKFFGPNNIVSDTLMGVDDSNGVGKVEETVANEVLNNPLSKKIIHGFTSAVNQAINAVDVDVSLPFEFKMDVGPSLTDSSASMDDAVNGLESNFGALLEIVENTSEDIADPDKFFRDFQNDLGIVAGYFGVEPLLSVIDDLGSDLSQPKNDIKDISDSMLSQNDFITIKLPGLADLCKLFGIGSWSGNNLKVKAKDAVFFPIAMIAWVTVYMKEGRSIKDVSSLQKGFESGVDFQLSSTNYGLWDEVRLSVDLVFKEVQALAWIGQVGLKNFDEKQGYIQLGGWMNWMKWTNDMVYSYSLDPVPDTVNGLIISCQALLGLYSIRRLSKDNLSEDDKSMVKWAGRIRTVLSIVNVVYNTAENIDDGTTDEPQGLMSTIGMGIAGTQGLWTTLQGLDTEQSTDAIEFFAALVAGSPALGYGLQITALNL